MEESYCAEANTRYISGSNISTIFPLLIYREKNMKQATKEKATTKVASPSKSDEPTSSSEKQPLLSMPEEEASYGAAASVEV
jgi:hypothetical protein